MIGRIEGRLHQVRPGEVLVDAGGVGYRVAITVRTFQELERQERAALWTHTQVRSDAIVLFGFSEHDELLTFERLIAVAGVGPRTALAVLSALSPGELAQAVESADLARIQRTPGVGKKTAERILLELKGRLQTAAGSTPDLRGDAVSALLNLGYGQREAQRAIDQVIADGESRDLGDLLRAALRKLTR
jgi:Holliday junction DNA helicase RuvA